MGKDFDRCGFEGLRLLGFPWGDLALALKWSTDFCFVNKHFLFPCCCCTWLASAGAFQPLCLCFVLFYLMWILWSWPAEGQPACSSDGIQRGRRVEAMCLPPGPHFAHSWQGKSISSWFIYPANERVMSPWLEGPKDGICLLEKTKQQQQHIYSSLSAKNSRCLKMTCCI